MYILGIETSCDETSVAIIEDGDKIRSNIISSQVEVHHQYGGIVPELASRRHIENILPVINQALKEAKLFLDDIELIGVTSGPGLIGALLIGLMTAKGIAYNRKIPLLGVNHLEGHLLSIFLTQEKPCFPFLSLLISGGHTNLYRVDDFGKYKLLGKTLDDAVGESFDKVARMLDLGYPGGPVLEKLAKKGEAEAIKFPRAFLKNSLDFSFSGMKTAVKQYLVSHKIDLADEQTKANIAAGFQQAIIDVISYKIILAAKKEKLTEVVLGGGVAANQSLRTALSSLAVNEGIKLFFPPVILCTDNAAMIACAAYYHFRQKKSPVQFDKNYIFNLEASANLEL